VRCDAVLITVTTTKHICVPVWRRVGVIPRTLFTMCPLLVGCSNQPMTLEPTVYVDEAFSADESAHVSDGLDNWESSVPGVSFTRRTMSHDALRNVSPEANTIYIVRNSRPMDPDCPAMENGHRGMNSDQCAVTIEEDGLTRGVICVDAVWLDSVQATREAQGKDGWRSTVIHEVGHAFHLVHVKQGPSVMLPVYWSQEDRLTCEDLGNVSRIWGTSVPTDCVGQQP
jgi:hypothetical protein